MNQRVLWLVVAACAALVAVLSYVDGSAVVAVAMTVVTGLALWQSRVVTRG